MNLFYRIACVFFFSLILMPLSSQTKGIIYDPALTGVGQSVFDANNDGYISLTSAGFNSGLGGDVNDGYNDLAEFEGNDGPVVEQWKKFPTIGQGEVLEDIRSGPARGFTDFSVDPDGFASYLRFATVDGVKYMIFRFRLADYRPNAKGYTVLVDSDGKIGSADVGSYQSGENPGFEFAILLRSKHEVSLIDLDGVATGCGTTIKTYDLDEYHQKSISGVYDGAGDIDVFYDFAIPFYDLTNLSYIADNAAADALNLRFAGTTNTSNTCTFMGSVSDIGGMDDSQSACWSCLLEEVIEKQCEQTASNIESNDFCTPCPSITSGEIQEGASFDIAGVATPGATVNIYVNGNNVGSAIANSLTGIYSQNVVTAVNVGDYVTAKAIDSSYGDGNLESSDNCNGITVSNACAGGPATLTVDAPPGQSGQIDGTTDSGLGTIADIEMEIRKYGTTTLESGFVDNYTDDGITGVWGYTLTTDDGSKALDGESYELRIRTIGGCWSDWKLMCGTGNADTGEIPIITSGDPISSGTGITIDGTIEIENSNNADGAEINIFQGSQIIGTTSVPGGRGNVVIWSIGSLSIESCIPVEVRARTRRLTNTVTGCFSTPATISISTDQSDTPTIDELKCGSVTELSGTSTESEGSVVIITANGNSVGTASVTSVGTWSLSGINLTSVDNPIIVTVENTSACETVSLEATANINTGLSIGALAINESSAITENTTNIEVTGSSSGNTINLYIDGSLLASKVADGTGKANFDLTTDVIDPSDLLTYSIYSGGLLTATHNDGTCESVESASVEVDCTVPASPKVLTSANSNTACNIIEVDELTIEASEEDVLYTAYVGPAFTDIIGYTRRGDGTDLTLYVGPFTSSGSVDVKVKGTKFVGVGVSCESEIGTINYNVNPIPDISNFTSPTATTGCKGVTSTVTVSSTSLLDGTYNVIYDITGTNSGSNLTAELIFSGDEGTFNTPSLPNTGSTTITITDISYESTGCNVPVSLNNSVTFLVNDSPLMATVSDNSRCGDGSVVITGAVGAGGNQVDFSEDGGVTVNGSDMDGSDDYTYSTSSITAGATALIHVRSYNTTTGCPSAWTNSATATAKVVPTAYAGSDPGDITCLNTTRTLSGSGGDSYLWSTLDGNITADANTSTPTINQGGTYSLVVTTNGCSSVNTANVIIGENTTVPDVASISDNIRCGDGDVILTATVGINGDAVLFSENGGVDVASTDNTSLYQYTVVGLSAGSSQIVHVASLNTTNGCVSAWANSATASAAVSATISHSSSNNPSTCSGTDGSIVISGLASSTDYSVSYTKDGSGVGPVTLSSNVIGNLTISNLPSGSYTNISVAIGSCTSNVLAGAYVLSDPATATIAHDSSNNPSTCSGTDGSIVISGLASSTSYTVDYKKNSVSVQATISSNGSGILTISGLTAGSYTDISVSESGCASNVLAGAYVLSDPATATISHDSSNNPSTCSGTDGSIVISGLASSASYTVDYKKNTVSVQETISSDGSGNLTISDLTAGSYTDISVSESGCASNVLAGAYVLSDPATATISHDSSNNPSTCSGTDGSIVISGLVTSTIYTVDYKKNTVSVQETISSDGSGNLTISDLTAGSYTDISVSESGCASNVLAGAYVLSDPATATIAHDSSNNPSTCSGTDGSIVISGLVTSTIYTVDYKKNTVSVQETISSDGSGNLTISDLTAGSYTDISVSESGCASNVLAGAYVLSDPATATIAHDSSNNPSTCSGTDGSIVISGLASSTSYTVDYKKNTVSVQETISSDGSGNLTISDLTAGSYTDISVSESGCASNVLAGAYVLSDPATATISHDSSNNPSTCSGTDGSIVISGLATSTSYTVDYKKNTVSVQATISSNGSGILTISDLTAGSYTDISVSESGCASNVLAGAYVLSDPATATIAHDSSNNPSTCSGTDGSIVISGLVTSTIYTVDYKKNTVSVQETISSDGSGNLTISDLTAGSYTDISVSESGCTSNILAGAYVLSDPATATIAHDSSNNPSTCSGTDGSIVISGLASSASYTVDYKKNTVSVQETISSDGSGNLTISGLTAGSYTDISVSESSCTSNILAGAYVLSDPATATIAHDSSNNPSTCSGTDGSIVISGLATSTSYTVDYKKNTVSVQATISSNGSGILTISGLTAGSYTDVSVSESSCTSNVLAGAYVLIDPATATIAHDSSNNPSTCSGTDGSIVISGLASSTSYTVDYKKNTVSVQATISSNGSGILTISGLTAGSYTDISVSESSCASNVLAGAYVLSDPTIATIAHDSSNNPSTCSGTDGSIVISGLASSTSYTVDYKKNTVSVQATISSNGSGILTISDLTAGSYTDISVSESGCASNVLAGAYVLSDPATATISHDSSNNPSTCSGTDGSIVISGLATSTSYTVDYKKNTVSVQEMISSDGSGNLTISDLTAGSYTDISVSESSCTSNVLAGAYVLSDPATATIAHDSSNNPSTCSGTDGSIVISGLASSTSYTVDYKKNTVSVQATISSNGSGILTISDLTAGSYTDISVSESGCASNVLAGAYVLSDPATATISHDSSNNPSTCSGTDGSIVISGLASSTSYTVDYKKNTVSVQATISSNGSGILTISGLTAGSYTDISISESGCASNVLAGAYVLSDPATATISHDSSNNPSTCSGTDGSIVISGLASSTSYTVDYKKNTVSVQATISSNGSGILTISGLTAGSYTDISVSESGCASNVLAGAYVLSDPATATISHDSSNNPSTCSGTDGSIVISGLATSTSYTVDYKKNTVSVQATIGSNGSGILTISGLTAGSYTDISISESGCASNVLAGAYVLSDPATATISHDSSNNPSTCSGTDGSIVISGLASSTSYTVDYKKNTVSVQATISSNGSGILTISGLTAGSYTDISVSESGCASNVLAGAYVLSDPATATISHDSSNNPSTCSGTDGSIVISGLASSTSYTVDYKKNTVSVQETISSNGSGILTISGLTAGSYTDISVSESGCASNVLAGAYVLSDPATATISHDSSNNPSTCSGTDGSIVISGLATSTSYTVDYKKNTVSVQATISSNGSGILTISGLTAGSYTDISVSESSCTSNVLAGAYVLSDPTTATIAHDSSNNPSTCSGTDGSIVISGLASSTSYTVDYKKNTVSVQATISSNGSGILTISGLTAGSYTDISVSESSCTSNVLAGAYVLSDPATATIAHDSSNNPSTCSGTDGSIVISGLATSTSYTVDYKKNTVSVQATISSNGSGILTISGLTAGSYTDISVSESSCTSNVLAGAYVLSDPATPIAPAFTGNNTPSCSEAGVIYTITSPNAGSAYNWTVPAGASIVANNNTSIEVDFGTTNGNVSVSETNSSTCTGPVQDMVIALQGCALNADFQSDNQSVCVDQVVRYENISTGTSGTTSYSWNFGADASPATATGVGPHDVIYTSAGLKTVVLTINDGATDVETKTDYITVKALPVPTFTKEVTSALAGTTAHVYETESGMSNYDWIVSVGGTITAGGGSSDNSVTVTWTTGGSHSVSVNYDENGCSGSSAAVSGVTVVPTISISDGTQTEGSGDLSFTISLNASSSEDVSVYYTTGDNTATVADNDYSYIALTEVVFTPGQTEKVITVPVTNDDVVEGDESLYVNLSSATNATIIDDQGVGTIMDNDGQALVTIEDVTVSEGGVATYTITLNKAVQGGVEVGYSVSDGSAIVGVDLNNVASTITFTGTAGETKTFEVLTTQDAIVEPSETYLVALSTTNLLVDATDGATGTITDNDVAGIQVSAISNNTNEAGQTATFTVVLTSKPTFNVTVGLSSDDLTEGTIAITQLVFSPADWNQPQTVVVTGVDDTDVDGDITYSIVLANAVSSDNSYHNMLVSDVVVVNEDDDVNHLPLATDDSAETEEETPVTVTILGNDTGLEDGGLVVTIPTQPTGGFVVVNSDHTITVTPDANFTGDLIFDYQVCDADGDCSTATVTVTVNAAVINALPLATDDSAETEEETPVTVTILGNDTGLEDGGLVVTIPTQPTGGFVVVNSDHTITVTPDANFTGDLIFDYQVCDADGDCSTATVTVTVNAAVINALPLATDDSAETEEETPVTVTILSNDTGLEDGGLVVTIPTQPTGGSVVVNSDHTITVTPDANFTGDLIFDYQVCDADGDCSTATVTVTVNAAVVDALPLATDDSAETEEETPVTVTILSNDTGLEDGGLVVTIPTQPTDGSVVVNSDHTITVTPDANFTGDLIFDYQVCDADGDCSTATVTVTVNAAVVDALPLATDDSAETEEETPVTVIILGNDTGLEDGGLVVTIPAQPTDGSVVVNSDHTITVTPDANFTGDLIFDYQVCDADSDCSTATVTVTVNAAVVDALPLATDDSAETEEETPVTVTILGNDTGLEDGGLVVTIPTQPTGGSVVVNSDHTITVTPDANFTDDLIFDYQVCDADGDCSTATVTITVNAAVINALPLATDDSAETEEESPVTVTILGNDTGLEDGGLVVTIPTQPTGGSVVVNSDHTITVTPDANFTGDLIFDYQVCDADGDCSTATVTVTVNAAVINALPLATDDSAETEEETPVTVTILGNDTGLEDGGLVVTIPTQPTDGSVVVNSDHTITVTPDANFTGDLIFDYQVCDADGDCSIATVTVTVNGVINNHPPVATDDIISVLEGQVLNGPALLENDTDPDGDALTIDTTPVSQPLYGELVINPDGTFVYTPDADFSGEDSFEYQVCDNGTPQECSTAIVYITVIESDTDGDGISDVEEGEGDTDGDGILDKEDADSDNDGILDEDEISGDCDKDGIPDRLDSDKCYEDELPLYEGFTPNNDGINDTYQIPWLTQFSKVSIEIFNRWGNVVYKQDKYENNWNGESNVGFTIGESQLPVGTYFYIIHIHDINKKLTGNIYLNR